MNRNLYIGMAIFMISLGMARAQMEYGYSRTIRIYAPNFKPYNDVEGSPFIPGDSVQQGWLLTGTKRLPVRLRYNSYTGEVEYVEGSKVLTPATTVNAFAILSPDTLQFAKGFPSTGAWSAKDFYQLLYNGPKAKLLKHVVSTIKSNTDAMANDYGKKSFQQREEYYVWVAAVQPTTENYFEKLSDGEMKPVVVSKKSLVSLFPQQTDKIERYLSDQKLKLKSWAEFARVLRFLDGQ